MSTAINCQENEIIGIDIDIDENEVLAGLTTELDENITIDRMDNRYIIDESSLRAREGMGPTISRQPHRSEGANSHGAWPSLRQMRSEVSLCT